MKIEMSERTTTILLCGFKCAKTCFNVNVSEHPTQTRKHVNLGSVIFNIIKYYDIKRLISFRL